MSRRVCFLPWTLQEAAAEVAAPLERFSFGKTNQHVPSLFRWLFEKKFEVACHAAPNNQALFGNLGSSDTIYVRGHGESGSDSISLLAEGGSSLKFDAVIDRLIATGLPKTFGGKIKFYSCESSQASHAHPKTTFAKSAGTYLRAKGYRNCRLFGYLGDISAIYNRTEPMRQQDLALGDRNQAPMQRITDAELIGKKHVFEHKWATPNDGVPVRAKDSRQEWMLHDVPLAPDIAVDPEGEFEV
jgi:hypothetical protein